MNDVLLLKHCIVVLSPFHLKEALLWLLFSISELAASLLLYLGANIK